MVKIDHIREVYNNLPQSIKNTARDYPEGRNILIKCLKGNTKRDVLDIIRWLKDNDIEIKDLDKYKVRIHDNDRDK